MVRKEGTNTYPSDVLSEEKKNLVYEHYTVGYESGTRIEIHIKLKSGRIRKKWLDPQH
jgi:hypothetical protein